MLINPKATVFTLEQLKATVKKRYRDEIHEDDIAGAFNDAQEKKQTLLEASEELVALYVKTDGHERNLILTVEELAARKLTQDKLGIVKSIISAMGKDQGATEADLKVAVRMQVTLRKLHLDSITLGSTIVELLVRENLAFVEQQNHRTPMRWFLAKTPRAKVATALKLKDTEIEALCPDFNNFIIYERSRRPAPQTEEV
jgi:hypothetical protein